MQDHRNAEQQAVPVIESLALFDLVKNTNCQIFAHFDMRLAALITFGSISCSRQDILIKVMAEFQKPVLLCIFIRHAIGQMQTRHPDILHIGCFQETTVNDKRRTQYRDHIFRNLAASCRIFVRTVDHVIVKIQEIRSCHHIFMNGIADMISDHDQIGDHTILQIQLFV